MKVSEAPAGRALDVAVAEHVMGWGVETRPGLRYVIPDGPHAELHRDLYGDAGDWQPSRDIAAAWEVVEKLLDFAPALYREGEAWELDLDVDPSNRVADDIVSGRGHTAPLAICRAALLAVGVTELP